MTFYTTKQRKFRAQKWMDLNEDIWFPLLFSHLKEGIDGVNWDKLDKDWTIMLKININSIKHLCKYSTFVSNSNLVNAISNPCLKYAFRKYFPHYGY